MAEYDEKVISVSVKAAELSGKVVLAAMKALCLMIQNHSQRGKMSLRNLRKDGRQLESVPIDQADLVALKKELKVYQVDYSVKKDSTQGIYHVFFKGQDLEAINIALKNCIERATKQTPLKERLQQAQQKAEKINRQNRERSKTQVHGRKVERGVHP